MSRQKQAKKCRIRHAQKSRLISMKDARMAQMPGGRRQAKLPRDANRLLPCAKVIEKTDAREAANRRRQGEVSVGPGPAGGKQRDSIKEAPQISQALHLSYNEQLGPPYHVILDTNFINFAIRNKIDLIQGMFDCLFAKCTPYLTDCVLAELEKMGSKYRVALRVAKDPRVQRLACLHKGTYADDCIAQRVKQHKCYIVATCDKGLRKRIHQIPGVPTMFIKQHRFTVERMPDAFGAPKK